MPVWAEEGDSQAFKLQPCAGDQEGLCSGGATESSQCPVEEVLFSPLDRRGNWGSERQCHLPSWFCGMAGVLDPGGRGSVCPGDGVQVQDTHTSSPRSPPPPSISSLKSRALSPSPLSSPPFLPRLPKELIYFSKYKWTLSHKDTTYVVSYVIC